MTGEDDRDKTARANGPGPGPPGKGTELKDRLKTWAEDLRREIAVLSLAARDPRTPRAARWLIVGAVAYALSPIDLIPDAIPVLGLLDDVLIVPAALWLARRMVPARVMAESRRRVAEGEVAAGGGRTGAVIVVSLWLALALALALWLWPG
ncbi:YkvA family protein [Histidinibacterium aquaticum]|uniref:YkvA family protein n=1 Tax=Histidinibacterium aquaticum TaxID=2613962 RepID=UPI001CC44CA0|nr:YkvA family protein [Histidinibacterium aquaticum]